MLVVALAMLGACSHDRVLAVGRSYTVRVVGGDGQTAPAGSVLPAALAVVVFDVAGTPVKAAVVEFRIARGDGAALLDSLAVTDENGRAEARLRLGSRAGAVSVQAFPLGAPARAATLGATALAGAAISGVLPANIGPGDTLRIAGTALGGEDATVDVGGARVRPIGGTSSELRVVVPACLPAGNVAVRVLVGSAWTEARSVVYTPRRRTLTLARFDATVIRAAELASCAALATDGGAEYVLVPELAAHAAAPVSTMARISAGGVSAAALFGGGAAFRAVAPRLRAQELLDARLRDEERRLAPMAAGGEPYQPPMLALTVGSTRQFKVITSLQGDAFTTVIGQLRWLGEHVGIYVDTDAYNALTNDDLARLGRLFDDALYRTAVESFGAEPDIDKNGKVLVFMSPKVNALAPAADCPLKGFVTGFFYGRDLIPRLANSNAGEIIYAMVPDPTARFSCSHAKHDTERLVSGTFVHEMQHLISYFQHVVARGGSAEEPWLNEGLSHIAEELASKRYEARFPAPLGRSTPEQLFPDSAQPFIAPQLLNAFVYLNSTPAHSVTTFAGSGSLEERGAAWLFLRWLGDQKGDAIFRQLVQTSQTGIANVEAQAGEPFAALFGDFSIALWTDSLPGVPRASVAPRYRYASRNLRQLMARQALIAGWEDPFPVKPVRVPPGGYAEGTLIQGTMVFGSLGPFSPGQPPIALGFKKQDGSAFAASDGAQVGIIRVK